MAQVVANTGMLDILEVYLNAVAAPTVFTLKLFTDAGTPAVGDTIAARTIATGGGYADIVITGDFLSITAASGVPTATWNEQDFIFDEALTGNPTIKGYAIMADAVLLTQELLSDPFTPANPGDTLTISPIFRMGNTTDAAAVAA
jgi:hypothetical protein